MNGKTGSFWEWVFPIAFVISGGWVIWHIPGFILDLLPPASESLFAQIDGIRMRKDVTPDLFGPFGGRADIVDWAAIISMPILFYFGMKTVRVANMEFQDWRPIDRVAIFVGRVTMILILAMTLVMLYEVLLRYAFEAPTKWANELTLWIGGFVFLLSGFYAMQQRCHIRIFILYDIAPRWFQRVMDVFSAFMVCVFAFFLVYGSFKQVFIIKFYKWEMFGTVFDPPIPATIQPMILIVVVLIAIQGVINVISDWNLSKEDLATSEVDEDEIEAIKRSVGAN